MSVTAVVTKTLSPQIMGDDQAAPGTDFSLVQQHQEPSLVGDVPDCGGLDGDEFRMVAGAVIVVVFALARAQRFEVLLRK